MRRYLVALLLATIAPIATANVAAASGGSTKGAVATPPPAQPLGFTGKALFYGRHSLIGDDPNESLNARLNLDWGFAHGQGFDFRAELYKDPSFNEEPPNILGDNVNEPKLEYQLTYTVPVSQRLSASAALLHHHNFRFEDAYNWAIATITYTLPITSRLTLANNFNVEKRLSGGRLFYDYSGTLDEQMGQGTTFETSVHRYENWGELDPVPTQKIEVETGFIKQLSARQTLAVSWMRHYQNGAANDQFTVLQLKYGSTFGPKSP